MDATWAGWGRVGEGKARPRMYHDMLLPRSTGQQQAWILHEQLVWMLHGQGLEKGKLGRASTTTCFHLDLRDGSRCECCMDTGWKREGDRVGMECKGGDAAVLACQTFGAGGPTWL
eukprot:353154-Chlamydomonas_euryale.AAC.6